MSNRNKKTTRKRTQEVIQDADLDDINEEFDLNDDEDENELEFDEIEEEEENEEENEDEEDDEENEEEEIIETQNSEMIDKRGNIYLHEIQKQNFRKLLLGEIIDPFDNVPINDYVEQIEQIHNNIQNDVFNYKYEKSVIIDSDHLNFLDLTEEELTDENKHELNFRTKVESDPDTCIREMSEILRDEIIRKYGKSYENEAPFYVRIKASTTRVKGFEQINSERLEKLVIVRGVVEDFGDHDTKKLVDVYYCKKCGATITVDQILDNQNIAPSKCESEVCKGKIPIKEWMPLPKLSKCIDFRHIVLREEQNTKSPKRVDIFITGDAINACELGRTISIVGTLHGVDFNHKYWDDSFIIPLKKKNIWASYIEVISKDDFYKDDVKFNDDEFYDKVSIIEDGERYFGDERDKDKKLYVNNFQYYNETLKPQIFRKREEWKKEFISLIAKGITGNEEIERLKDGARLWLTQGVDYIFKDGLQRRRGTIHMLNIGEQGTAKTKFGKGVIKFIDGARYTSAKGSTGVGLTVSMINDPITKSLTAKAGALVLAHESGVCIDEFGRFPSDQQDMLLEQMEDETISIDKAGKSYVFDAKTPIIALTNPVRKGTKSAIYDVGKPLAENLYSISEPILSRFDLKFIQFYIDQRNPEGISLEEMVLKQEERARKICRHILRNGEEERKEERKKEDDEKIAEEERMKFIFAKQYIKFAKQRIKNKAKPYKSLFGIELLPLDDASIEIIEDEYINIIYQDFGTDMRKFFDSNRMIESIRRLAEADAKFYLQDTVHEYNTRDVIDLYKYTIDNAITIYGENGLSSDPSNTDSNIIKLFSDIITPCIIDNYPNCTMDILVSYILKFRKCTPKGEMYKTRESVAKKMITDVIDKNYISYIKENFIITNKGEYALDSTKLMKYKEKVLSTTGGDGTSSIRTQNRNKNKMKKSKTNIEEESDEEFNEYNIEDEKLIDLIFNDDDDDDSTPSTIIDDSTDHDNLIYDVKKTVNKYVNKFNEKIEKKKK